MQTEDLEKTMIIAALKARIFELKEYQHILKTQISYVELYPRVSASPELYVKLADNSHKLVAAQEALKTVIENTTYDPLSDIIYMRDQDNQRMANG